MQTTYRSSSIGLDTVEQRSGFELRGLLMLLICGFYAVLLFLTAALIRWAWSLVPSPLSFLRGKVVSSKTPQFHSKKGGKTSLLLKPRKETNHG